MAFPVKNFTQQKKSLPEWMMYSAHKVLRSKKIVKSSYYSSVCVYIYVSVHILHVRQLTGVIFQRRGSKNRVTGRRLISSVIFQICTKSPSQNLLTFFYHAQFPHFPDHMRPNFLSFIRVVELQICLQYGFLHLSASFYTIFHKIIDQG